MNVRWWRSRSQAARFDLYVRAMFYANFILFPALAAGSVDAELRGWAPWVAGALTAAHTATCLMLVHAGLAYHLGRRARPTALIAAAGAATVAGAVAALLAFPSSVMALVLVVAFVAALSTAAPPRIVLAVGAAGCVAALGASDSLAPVALMAAAILFLVAINRASMWTLAVVWELDRSRHLQASLAVAEERLRFSRDLHDVVGRTLSVVSLKAALAAQLSKRGRPEATDEMLEVRRIAEESLAELRAVVGGYRAAELDVELAGARALLASAGIRCHVSVSVPSPADPVAGGGTESPADRYAGDGAEPLPGRVAVAGDGGRLPAEAHSAFGWVVREGTTNVLRHSEATTCTITLRVDGGSATLTMDNDGVANTGAGGGTGIVGLTERIATLGGTVTATHQPPDRFRLTARLPLTRTEGMTA